MARWGVLLLSLLDPLSPAEANRMAAEFGAGRTVRAWIRSAKEEAMEVRNRLLSSRVISRKFVYDALAPLPNEVILYLMAKAKHPDIKRYISLYFTQLKSVRTRLTGKDLIRLGYSPGLQFKSILDDLLERRFAGQLRTKDDEISFLLSRYPRG